MPIASAAAPGPPRSCAAAPESKLSGPYKRAPTTAITAKFAAWLEPPSLAYAKRATASPTSEPAQTSEREARVSRSDRAPSPIVPRTPPISNDVE